jgi:hypothetical protein
MKRKPNQHLACYDKMNSKTDKLNNFANTTRLNLYDHRIETMYKFHLIKRDQLLENYVIIIDDKTKQERFKVKERPSREIIRIK